MQFKTNEYNKDKHDKFLSLTVKQPYADDLVTPAYKNDGIVYGVKTIEVRSKNTKHRGDLLICSSKSPEMAGKQSGVTLGFVDLYHVKPISEFTPDDWDNTRIPINERSKIKKGYGWLMRNPRRVIEFPVIGQLGIYNLIYTKGVIMEYPRVIVMDKASYDLINKKEK